MYHRRGAAFHETPTHKIPDELVLPEPKRILILEDDPVLVGMLTDFLKSNNFLVTSVANGADGVQHILKSSFDVILCDMVMPNFPGDMFYLAVERTRPHLCNRFIFMTGQLGNPEIETFIRQIRGFMLWKPFELHELMGAIKTVIDRGSNPI